MVTNQEAGVRQGILDWIAPPDHTTRQSDILRNRQKGSCQWLLDSPRFKSWLEDDKQILFCPGIPGAGKTISTSIVVEELVNRFGGNKSVGIAYLYCSFQWHNKQSIQDLMSSLLRQLIGANFPLPTTIVALHDSHRARGTRPSAEDICVSLTSIANTYSRVFIAIDGLDECQAYSSLLSQVFSLQNNCPINLFATSRFVPEITRRFVKDTSLEIRADDADVRTYLHSQVSTLPHFIQRSTVLQEEIKNAIVQAVDGMYVSLHFTDQNLSSHRFLLARLHLDSLRGKKSPRAVRQALINLPSGSNAYDTAYELAMKRIEGQVADEVDLAKQVLAWITCTKRPLTSSELQCALAVEIGDLALDEDNLSDLSDLITVCAGLVTVDEQSDIVRLVHYTTQEFFNRTRNHWFPNIEAEIAMVCVTYLSFSSHGNGVCSESVDLSQGLQSGHFVEYATGNWGHHAFMATKETQTEPLVLKFLENERSIANATLAMTSHAQHGRTFFLGAKPLHLVAYFGLNYTANMLLHCGHDPNARDADGQTPLMWAVSQGHESVSKELLATHSTIDSCDNSRRTALHHAASLGQSDVIKVLIEYHADLEARDMGGQTPLLVSVGCSQKDAMEVLLSAGAAIDVCDNERKSALHLAIEGENFGTDIVNSLLAHTAPIDVVDTKNMKPLHCTISHNRDDIVDLLLQFGATIDTKVTRRNWTRKNQDGADVYGSEHEEGNQTCGSDDTRGLTPLHFAALVGDAKMTKLFLSLGADPNTQSYYGETPLHLALSRTIQGPKYQDAWNENRWRLEDLWDVVLDHDEDVQDDAPAHILAVRKTVIETLLGDERIDVTLKDFRGATMLHNVDYKESWISPIVRMLVEKGVEVSAQNRKGQTALHLASLAGNLESVAILIAEGSNLGMFDNDGKALIHYAVKSHDFKMIKFILDAHDGETSCILNFKDSNGRTALHHSVEDAYSDRAAVVSQLTNLGARADITDNLGNSPLAHYFSHFRFWSDPVLCRILLDSGAKDILTNQKGDTLAELYVTRGKVDVEVLQLLREYNVDMHNTDSKGRTLLHKVALNGFLTVEALHFLKDLGIHNHTTDSVGKTALQYAAEKAAQKHHPYLFDSNRWSRTVDILQQFSV